MQLDLFLRVGITVFCFLSSNDLAVNCVICKNIIMSNGNFFFRKWNKLFLKHNYYEMIPLTMEERQREDGN